MAAATMATATASTTKWRLGVAFFVRKLAELERTNENIFHADVDGVCVADVDADIGAGIDAGSVVCSHNSICQASGVVRSVRSPR